MKTLRIGRLYKMISGSRRFLPAENNGNGWSGSGGPTYSIEAGETFLIIGEAMLYSPHWMIALYRDKFVFVPVLRPGDGENVYEELVGEE